MDLIDKERKFFSNIYDQSVLCTGKKEVYEPERVDFFLSLCENVQKSFRVRVMWEIIEDLVEFKNLLEDKISFCKKIVKRNLPENFLKNVDNYIKREEAAIVIQRAFVKARYDPKYKLCERILINNLRDLGVKI